MPQISPDPHVYQNPLISRYATREMAENFSDQHRYVTWRKLWVALAKASREAGANVSEDQIRAMEAVVDSIPFARIRDLEKDLRHDVMAHIHAFGEQARVAKPIIHLGATSCYVTDNADLILMRDGLRILLKKLVDIIRDLAEFAKTHQSLITLAYTHCQPAQPTTVGKRACLWLYDLMMDLEDLQRQIDVLPFRGVKGTTGTQASFLDMLGGHDDKVARMDDFVCREMGFAASVPVSGQTYTRKIDHRVLAVLAGIAQSSHKFSNDMRLLQSMGELEEPFQERQVGSSAMPYKRNPMRSERMAALARYVLCLEPNTSITASTQWFERTLDDSANRRIVIPEAFLASDGILNLYQNIVEGMVVHPGVIRQRLKTWLPFLISEKLLVEGVRQGGDRQDLHERIRRHTREAADAMLEGTDDDDLLQRLQEDPVFRDLHMDFGSLATPERLAGRSAAQVQTFLSGILEPLIRKYDWVRRQSSQVEV